MAIFLFNRNQPELNCVCRAQVNRPQRKGSTPPSSSTSPKPATTVQPTVPPKGTVPEKMDLSQVMSQKSLQKVDDLSVEQLKAADNFKYPYTVGGGEFILGTVARQSKADYDWIVDVASMVDRDQEYYLDEDQVRDQLATLKYISRQRNNYNQVFSAIETLLANRYNYIRQQRGRAAKANSLKENELYTMPDGTQKVFRGGSLVDP